MQTRFTAIFTRAAIALLLMMLTTVTTWAQTTENLGGYEFTIETDAVGSYYVVDGTAALNALATYVNAGNDASGMRFKQTADITYTGTDNYTPIGLYVNTYGFQGTFDGQGHTISGIDCTGDGLTGKVESLGLFGYNEGTIRNVTLSGCRFASANNENNGNNAMYVYIGSIAGINNNGTISNCTVTGGTVSRTRTADANGFETFIGGIAGENTGSITDCTYSGSVSGIYSGSNTGGCVIHIGGIVGISKNGGSITGCGSDAAVSCSTPNVDTPRLFVGGIAGVNNGLHGDVTVSDCFFSGTLSGTGKTGGNTVYIYIGAFVGRSLSRSIVTNNYYYGDYAATIGYESSTEPPVNLVRVYQLTTANGITATAPEGSGTTFKGVSYFKADATVTLAPQAGYAITAASYNDGSDHEITAVNDVWSFTMPSSNVTVSATTAVLYLIANGNTQNCTNFTILDNTMNDLAAGWYVVNSDVTYSGDLRTNASGNVNIILCDGKTLTASGISPQGSSDVLKIYGQSQGTGTANISGTLYSNYSLTINGGTINAGRLETCQGSISINGGTVNVTGNIAPYSNVYLWGGNVTVTGAIKTDHSSDEIVLGGATVKAGSYSASGKVQISGVTYYDGTGASYAAGNLTPTEIAAIAGKTLRPFDYRAGTCGDPNVNSGADVTWAVCDTDGKDSYEALIIGGNGAMADYNNADDQPWKDYRTTITSVVIKSGVTSIGNNAFYNCSALTTITIPSGVTTIGNRAFYNCSALTTITIPSGVTTIGNDAFNSCSALTAFTIPSGVTSIGNEAFSRCSKLESFNVEAGNTYYASEDGVLFNYDKTTLVLYPIGNTASSYTIPASVKTIGQYAFRDNKKLTSVTISNSVETISSNAFYGYRNLATVAFAPCSQLKRIGGSAFYDCQALTSIIIPGSVGEIGSNAFDKCKKLASVTIYPIPLTGMGSSIFDNNKDGRKIYVFSSCVNSYKSASNFSAYASAIEPIPALTVNDAGGTLGKWTTYYNGLANVEVPDGTTIYKASYDKSANNVTLTPVDGQMIKMGEAVLLKSDADIVLSANPRNIDGDYDDNDLHGVDYATPLTDLGTTTDTYYVLGNKNGHFGFHKYTGTNMPANKAFLLISGDGNALAPSLSISINGNETGIVTMSDVRSQMSEAWYTLEGRKLDKQPTAKGMYIHNGRKEVVK